MNGYDVSLAGRLVAVPHIHRSDQGLQYAARVQGAGRWHNSAALSAYPFERCARYLTPAPERVFFDPAAYLDYYKRERDAGLHADFSCLAIRARQVKIAFRRLAFWCYSADPNARGRIPRFREHIRDGSVRTPRKLVCHASSLPTAG